MSKDKSGKKKESKNAGQSKISGRQHKRASEYVNYLLKLHNLQGVLLSELHKVV